MEAFEEQRIHLVTQAASDLNFTVVVDEDQSEKLVRQLHAQLISEHGSPEVFGPTWQQLREEHHSTPPRALRWWEKKQDELLAIAAEVPAAYVYDLETVDRQLDRLGALRPLSRVFYAMKANAHPDILRRVRTAGAGLECVSEGELDRVFSLFPDLDPGEVIFTPNFAPREEYAGALERGVRVTLDALHPIQHWGELFAGGRSWSGWIQGGGRDTTRRWSRGDGTPSLEFPASSCRSWRRWRRRPGPPWWGCTPTQGAGSSPLATGPGWLPCWQRPVNSFLESGS
jgi:bifunctional diaminopimelate decarboxylase / aspartate kinase